MRRAKYLLEKYNLAPLSFLSQNFLISEKIINKMAAYAQKTTLEIGPGLGFLTEKLSRNADTIIAVEKDRGMVRLLKNEYTFENVEIYHADFLETDFAFDCCVSSVPYSISSPIIVKLLETDHQYSVLLLQKEYTEKILRMRSRLGVMVNALADIEIIGTVGRRSFYPAPRVDSVIAKITPNRKVEAPLFENTVRVLFQHKRKKVINALADSSHELGIDKKKAKSIFSEIIHREKRVFNLSIDEIEEIAYSLEEILKNRNQENAG
jgi:16S rRNA (adenine1518-N6/adenine1519-N6)-dimethyltransferase